VKWSFLVLPSFPSGSQHKAKPHFSSTQASHHPPAKISQLCQLYTCTVASFSPLGPFASLHLDFYHFFKVMKLLWTVISSLLMGTQAGRAKPSYHMGHILFETTLKITLQSLSHLELTQPCQVCVPFYRWGRWSSS
jgi:hypothetical protein